MEDLNINGMQSQASKKLSSKIHAVGWYTFRLRMENEAEKLMSEFILAPIYYPSTRTCSDCGNVINHALP